MTEKFWDLATGRLALDKPHIMGIINLTPDSFSDGGKLSSPAIAKDQALAMIESGASMLDIGAESTRPGAIDISASEQIKRLDPLLNLLTESPVPLTIDSSEVEVIRYVSQHPRVGAINDVRALTKKNALEELSKTKLGACLMHMQGTPQTMQQAPSYTNCYEEVKSFLVNRAAACESLGIDKNRIAIDPGFGFGKLYEHNLELFHHLPELADYPYTLLVGLSKKRMIGEITGQDIKGRTTASAMAAALAIYSGANIVRVHDVEETRDAISVIMALKE